MEKKNSKKTYLYLARRDKKGIKILTAFPNGKDDFPPTRLTDINKLGLPEAIATQLQQEIHKERMMWEPFLECADGYGELVQSLRRRGYGMIPMHFAPSNPVVGRRDGNKQIHYPTPELDKKAPSMLRKKT